MKTRNEYLKKVIRPQYLKATKKEKGVLLNKAEEATRLKRKYLMEKLKPSSNIDVSSSEKRKRKQYYDNSIKPALIDMWEILIIPVDRS